MERTNLEVFKAAVEFAKADEEYIRRLHAILHKGSPQAQTDPSPEELEELFRLQVKRDELEDRFFSLWLGDGWRFRARLTRR